MEVPNYVMKTEEANLMPKKGKQYLSYLKVAIWIIVGVIIVGSLLFGDNLFSELSWTVRSLLIGLVIYSFFWKSAEFAPSPVEIQFYNEYMIIHRPKLYYKKKLSRMEYAKMQYVDITKIRYIERLQRLTFHGTFHCIWYDYNKDGSVPSNPSFDRVVKDTIDCIGTRFLSASDIISEIEAHTPLKVIYE